MVDNDPFGLNEYASQKWAIFKYRLFRRTFWPIVAALVSGAAYAVYKVMEWAGQ